VLIRAVSVVELLGRDSWVVGLSTEFGNPSMSQCVLASIHVPVITQSFR
jgi:hypothetical protein